MLFDVTATAYDHHARPSGAATITVAVDDELVGAPELPAAQLQAMVLAVAEGEARKKLRVQGALVLGWA